MRAIVALDGGIPDREPFVLRARGRSTAAIVAAHEADVLERERRCLLAAEQLAWGLRPLGGEVLHRVPAFQMCIVRVRASRLDAIAKLANVRGVWRDSYAPSHGRPARPLSDPVPLSVEHHRALLAHAAGYTGQGSTSWAPVMAILDGPLPGFISTSGTTRHHAVLNAGGTSGGASRVLADLDWNSPPTPLPVRPLNTTGKQPWDPPWTNVYHGLGVAGIAAGSAVPGPGIAMFSVGHAPNAGIVGMNIIDDLPIYNNPNCGSQPAGHWAYQSQVLLALNKIAALKFTYTGVFDATRPIRVANLSYGGPPNPTHPTNEALRSLMADYDILVVTSAGNTSLPYESLYNVNGLTVGGYDSWFEQASGTWGRVLWNPPGASQSTPGPLTRSRTLSYCSAGGDADPSWPLPNNFDRQFPDIGAVASSQVTAVQDDETLAYVTDGTSLAAPHVTGAAILAMAGPDGAAPATPWTSLETRAALLATTENAIAGGNGDNLTGAGFLRTDRVTSAASTHGLSVSTASVSGAQGTVATLATFPVVAGQTYSAAISWLAMTSALGITTPNWADLDLTVTWPGGTANANSAFGNRTWERLEFIAAAGGTATVSTTVLRGASAATIPVAVATARVDAAGGPPANVSSVASTTPSTCQVQQIQPATQPSYQSVGSPPPVPLNDLRDFLGASLTRDDRWVAFKFDGMALTAFGVCGFGWAPGTHLSIPLVTRVELRTNSPREMVVPCMLGSGNTGGSPFNTASYPRNEWRGWMRIPAGLGTATAEFYAESSPSSDPAFSPPRWFCVKLPPDVKCGRVVPPVFCSTLPFEPWVNCAFAWATDDAGTTWSAPTYFFGHDLKVYGAGSPMFSTGTPTLTTVEPASVTSGAIEIIVSGGEQATATRTGDAYLLIDTVVNQTTDIQLIEPALNGTCTSLLKSTTLALPIAGVFGANTGPGLQVNPTVGSTGRLLLPFVASPTLIGATVHLQLVEAIPVPGGTRLRPSSIESVTTGL
ncbi:MAG: S8 family serine peptidase [Planctomycetes bacterium]|nr:S8 family serine peptidase [Planctomycetota bacterium]